MPGQTLKWKNSATSYGAVSQLFHWVTAFLMILDVVIGLYSMTLPRDSMTPPSDIAWREFVLLWHKSFGLLVIMLTVLRLAWLWFSPARLDHGNMPRWEVWAAKLGHLFLYFLLLTVPLSGLLMSEGAGRETTFFNLFTVPNVIPLDPALQPREQYWYLVGKFLHQNVFNWLLYAGFVAHMAGVIKHRFIDGDRTSIARMWGRPPTKS